MIAELGTRHGTGSARAVSFVAAAILLILNWALPGAPPLGAPFGSRDAGPGLSPGLRSAPSGHFPRAQPRLASFESTLPKADRSGWPMGGKQHSLLNGHDVSEWFGERSIAPGTGTATPRIAQRRTFNARAPPRLPT